jgi:hypothetical protein
MRTALQHPSRPVAGRLGAGPARPRPTVRWPGLQRARATPQQCADQQPQQQGGAETQRLADVSTAQSWSDFSVRVALERLYQVNLGRHLWEAAPGALGSAPLLPAYLAVSLEEKPPAYKERAPDFYANVGDAIRTLRDDIPLLFERELNCERAPPAAGPWAPRPRPAPAAPAAAAPPAAACSVHPWPPAAAWAPAPPAPASLNRRISAFAARPDRRRALTAPARPPRTAAAQTRSTRRTSSSRTRATASRACRTTSSYSGRCASTAASFSASSTWR